MGPQQHLAGDVPSVEEVELLWREAQRTLTEAGFEAFLDRREGPRWGVSFEKDQRGHPDFERVLESATIEAELAQRRLAEFQMSQDGALAAEAASFEECASKCGVPVSFDLDVRSRSKTLQAAIEALGFEQDDRAVIRNPQFRDFLECMGRHEDIFDDSVN